MLQGWPKPLVFILLLSFVLRISGALYWQSTMDDGTSCFRFGDSDTYWVHADRIAAGETYRYLSDESRIFRAPLYPLFLSPFAYIADGAGLDQIEGIVLLVRIIGSLIGTVCVGLIWWLTRRLGGDQAAHMAALLAAAYPGAVGMSIFALSEMIFCPLMLASLACSYLALDVTKKSFKNPGWIFLAGILSGMACLARPSWGLWAGFWWLYQSVPMLAKPSFKTLLDVCGKGFVYVAGIALAMCPWWIRNYQITGKFVPSTLQVGASLYDGWHEGATGSSDEGMAFVNRYLQEQLEEDRAAERLGKPLESTLEWRLDRRLRNAAIDWVSKNPSDAIKLAMVKFWKTWRPLPVAQELGSNGIRYAEGISYALIMGFGALGLWVSRNRSGAWLFAVPTVYFGIMHMAFIGSVRYRQPAVMVMCILAGCGIVYVLDRTKWIQRMEPKR